MINIGVHPLADSLEQQGVDFVQIDWVPPAGRDQEMMDLLDIVTFEWRPVSLLSITG